MATMPDPYTVLTAVADHIHTNPMLADTVTSVSPGRGELQIYPVVRTGPRRHLRVLAQWISSAYDVAPAIVTAVPDGLERTHLALRCQLHDGTAVTVIMVLKGADHEVLVSSVADVLRVGDAVPIELLLRLADGWTAAEAEPIPTEGGPFRVEEVDPVAVGEVMRAAALSVDEACGVEPAEDTTP